VKTAQDNGAPLRLIETTVAINDQRKRAMARKVARAIGPDIHGKTIALLGLTFKPNTDDMRDSPALAIVQGLQDGGANVRAFDPEGMEAAKAYLTGVTLGADPYEIAEGADALVLVTEWDAFRALDFARLKKVMKEPLLVDLRNVYRRDVMARHGFRYVSIGRPKQDISMALRPAAE
jgi:UDPglucose 6-dehydrogenase